MGIPTGAARDVAPLHGLVPTEQVLVDPSPDVVKAGHAVGGGRTLVEDPGLPPFALAHGAREDVVLAPTGQFGLFKGYKIKFGADRAKHKSPSVSSSIVLTTVAWPVPSVPRGGEELIEPFLLE